MPEKKITLTTDLEIDLLEQVHVLQCRVELLEDALCRARLFVGICAEGLDGGSPEQVAGAAEVLDAVNSVLGD